MGRKKDRELLPRVQSFREYLAATTMVTNLTLTLGGRLL